MTGCDRAVNDGGLSGIKNKPAPAFARGRLFPCLFAIKVDFYRILYTEYTVAGYFVYSTMQACIISGVGVAPTPLL